jgi:DnaJ-class molecular chaperone
MPINKVCDKCGGKGYYLALINANDCKKEITTCNNCNGKGKIIIMTDEEEEEYWNNYW